MRTAAVIPCYNEQSFISDVVSGCKQYVNEVIVCDDSSTDDTVHIAELAGGVIVSAPLGAKHGVGANTRRGIEYAISNGASIIVTLDGDGQHDPKDIPTLLQPILEKQADVVIGSRFLRSGYSIRHYRKIGIDIITQALNLGSRFKLSDGLCCFRAFLSYVLKQITITESGFGFCPEVIAKTRLLDYRLTEVPVSCIYHDRFSDNSTQNPVRQGIALLAKAAKWRAWEIAQGAMK
jgi:glycosyltransferase involved in cell wall biosynthesis